MEVNGLRGQGNRIKNSNCYAIALPRRICDVRARFITRRGGATVCVLQSLGLHTLAHTGLLHL
jgi:hypothetical protein